MRHTVCEKLPTRSYFLGIEARCELLIYYTLYQTTEVFGLNSFSRSNIWQHFFVFRLVYCRIPLLLRCGLRL